ncbi:MAG TPA: ABC-F family ATP-binding cassette domain-containing protein [Candidatus Kapabacteria bacterium]|nr:ABC-F family ATP-binding cassette domain-containing protein [Candidatus Kapabacteria bacterium]
MTILSIENLGKNFGIKPLFTGLTFGVQEGERVGLIGANGSGKTTLLRIIAGAETPDTGRVMLAGSPVVGYLPQNPPFDENQTVLDAIFTASNESMRLLSDYEHACHELAAAEGTPRADEPMRRVAELAARLESAGAWELETNATVVLAKLGITDTGARMGQLSGGQRKRVALAHALIERPDLLILDEPTNHLDAETIEWLEEYLARYSGALLLVTHDRYFLDRVTDHIVELDRGAAQTYAGNYSYYLERKEEMETQKAVEQHKRDMLIRQELAWLRRGAKARTTKQKARIERAEDLMTAPREKAKDQLDVALGSRRLGSKVLELRNVSKAFDETVLLENFTYTVQPRERLGIIGPNGAGKTTLLEMITGGVKPDTGTVETGQTVAIGYYDQESSALADELRVIDYIREVAENVRTADGSVITAGQMLERFLFPPDMQYARIARLSGGERRRLYLLRILMGAPNVLLLDEPTNDLDIDTLMALEDYLDSFPGTVIVVSHDRYFLDRTVDHLFRFEGNGRIREYPGNYSAFLEIRAREAAEAAPQPAQKQAAAAPAQSLNTVQPAKLSYKERKELNQLETEIAKIEETKAEIETKLADVGADYVAAQELAAQLSAANARLDAAMERWTELAERDGG